MMRNAKKTVAWILGMVMLLSFGMTAGESFLPEIPVFESTLNTRPITTAEDAEAYAKEFWALDYVGLDMSGAAFSVTEQDNGWIVSANVGDEYADVAFDKDGNILYMENIGSGWEDSIGEYTDEEEEAPAEEPEVDPEIDLTEVPEEEPVDEEEERAVEWRENLDRMMEYPFLAEVNPAVYELYAQDHPIDEGSNEFLTHYSDTFASNSGDKEFDLYYSECYDNAQYRIKIVVQFKPVVRIVFFDVNCDPEEGGNG